MKDYSKLTEITVKSQEELNDIPTDFKGRIYIEFGTIYARAVVDKRYYSSVVARENSRVEAWDNSRVEAWENSSVVARGNSSVVARGNSSVVAWGNSRVEAWGNSRVEAWENSRVEAWENSSVEAWGNSSVVARGNSRVEASSNVQVVDYLQGAKIKISGNARIVYMPKCIFDFMDFYGIKHTKTTATFYKAVHKKDDRYFSDYNNSFDYEIGKTITNAIDTNTDKACGEGLHICHLNWALDFGRNWEDLAILEVRTKIEDIILPKNNNGKVRTSKLTVLREVPLGKCGLYGKILARRV